MNVTATIEMHKHFAELCKTYNAYFTMSEYALRYRAKIEEFQYVTALTVDYHFELIWDTFRIKGFKVMDNDFNVEEYTLDEF